MGNDSSERELSPFQLRNIRLLTHLLAHDAVDDDIVNELRQTELEYYALLEKCRILETRVNIDEKTSLLKYSKGYLTTIIKTASRIYQSVESTKYPTSLVRFDIDDFSKFNTLYGHEIGDRVLVMVCSIIRGKSRPTDYVIRYGGEEIDVILPGIRTEGALVYVERIMDAIRSSSLEVDERELGVTVSAGVSYMEYRFDSDPRISAEDIEKMYLEIQKHADDALYEAKCRGKNRVCVYDEDKRDYYLGIRKEYDEIKSC